MVLSWGKWSSFSLLFNKELILYCKNGRTILVFRNFLVYFRCSWLFPPVLLSQRLSQDCNFCSARFTSYRKRDVNCPSLVLIFNLLTMG
jgi:hypothetical protein